MSDMIRPDGRKTNEMRDLSVEVGVLSRADGSAKVHLGKNMAIASVNGPREQHPRFLAEADKALVKVNYRMATFSVTDYKRSFPSRREKEISKVLAEAFESVVLTKHFPRSAVDIHVQIFESDGGTRTAAAIAVSAALADAGIPMRDLMGGIASGLYDDQVCLDLSGHEDMKGTGDMPMLYSPELDEIGLFQLDGKFTLEQFKEAFNMSIEAIKGISATIREALRHKYLKVKEEIGVTEVEEKDEAEIQSIIQEEFISEETIPKAFEETTPEITDEVTPNFPSDEASDFDPADEEDLPPALTKETVPEANTATSEEVIDETPIDDDTWYDKSLGLRPMATKPGDEQEDIIRDLEYSSLEEDE